MPTCCNDDSLVVCCDMRGLLSFMILWLLTKKNMYGQELADEIAKRKGTKPNPGTLYPALSQLEENGIVVTKLSGRKKVYYLTESGKKSVHDACRHFCKIYGEIFEEYGVKK